MKEQWVIPPAGDADFVCAMEDVLELYHEPYDPDRPMVCFDEASKQLISEVRQPMPMIPGFPERFDYEYAREGTRNLFMFFEPLRAWRHVEVTERHTTLDFAAAMKQLADDFYPEATTIRVVLDNLNTHKPASLYEAYSPEEARRIVSRLEFHYTPKHGSWLNMAEIEIGVLRDQCLDRRIPDQMTLKHEIAHWETRRNSAQATVRWHFTTQDARIKLHSLYPSIQP